MSVLKIDRSFIAHLENIKNMLLVEGIIKTAHDLEIKVVAEWVETEEQLKLLQNMKCDYLQGYYFSKPMNEWAMQVKLASGKWYNAT